MLCRSIHANFYSGDCVGMFEYVAGIEDYICNTNYYIER